MKPWFQASNQKTWEEGLVGKSSTALEIVSVKTARNWWKRCILKTLGHVMKKQNYYIRLKQEQQSSHCSIDWCSVMFFGGLKTLVEWILSLLLPLVVYQIDIFLRNFVYWLSKEMTMKETHRSERRRRAWGERDVVTQNKCSFFSWKRNVSILCLCPTCNQPQSLICYSYCKAIAQNFSLSLSF